MGPEPEGRIFRRLGPQCSAHVAEGLSRPGCVPRQRRAQAILRRSLQVSLQRHLTTGWLWGTEYMWSHGLAWGGFGAGEYPHVENYDCIRCSYGSSQIDVRQSLSVNSVYELPIGPGKPFLNTGGVAGKLLGGWQLRGIVSAPRGR